MKDFDFVFSNTDLKNDVEDALMYFNSDNLKYFPKEISSGVKSVLNRFEINTNEKHKKITSTLTHFGNLL